MWAEAGLTREININEINEKFHYHLSSMYFCYVGYNMNRTYE